MSDLKKGKPETKKTNGSTTIAINGERLAKVKAFKLKCEQKAGVEVKMVSVIKMLIDKGFGVAEKR